VSTTTTLAELKKRALQELGVLRLGQDAKAQDSASIEKSYYEIYEALKEQGLATWASAGPIPDKIVPHVVALVAMNRSNTYSISQERLQRIVGMASGAVPGIRALVTPKGGTQEQPDDF